MKDYFLKLFGYDYYANEIILKAILEAGSPEQAVKLMAHTLAAQQVWLARCREDTNPPAISLWAEDWKADEQLIINHQNNKNWLHFLENKTDLDTVFTYTTSTGLTFTNSMVDILAHIINHGTHHRAQAGQVLKNASFKLPNTDYIMYLRNK